MVQVIPRDTTGYVVAKQLARSGTSIGANVEEAQGSHSRKEFIRKINIARSEAREVLYWLRLVSETEMVDKGRLPEIINEADELVRILTTIVKRSKLANEKT